MTDISRVPECVRPRTKLRHGSTTPAPLERIS